MPGRVLFGWIALWIALILALIATLAAGGLFTISVAWLLPGAFTAFVAAVMALSWPETWAWRR